MAFTGQTSADGQDYFDLSEFDATTENNSRQVVKAGAPTEDGDTPQYWVVTTRTKLMERHRRNVGFNWYCPEVRGTVWNRYQPCWLHHRLILKTYTPADQTALTQLRMPVDATPSSR